VAGIVRQTPYSFGYVELIYAKQNRMIYGRVRNSSGKFVKAELSSMKAAAETVANAMPDDFRVSITNAPGRNAYPISSYTWLLMPERAADPEKRKIIADFLRWALTYGQPVAETLGYAPLPRQVAAQALLLCNRVR
jgi:phosphate transport system substrate-binding protein